MRHTNATTWRRALGRAAAMAWLLAAPLFASELAAQADTTRRAAPRSAADSAADEARLQAQLAADSVRRDSLDRAIKGDTVKAPLARFEMPADLDGSSRLRFSREALLATGAVNLTDLLDKVPGVTTYRSGWMAGIHAATFAGDGSRVRLFLDGVELDPLGARGQGLEDLTDIALWSLDELVIERAAGEVRVWMRSWTVTKTIPYTRVDVFTGDLNTNAFRGQFARRWRNGLLLQLGGQQIATQSGQVSAFGTTGGSRARSDGTMQGILLRTGWSRGRWSVDAFAQAVSRDRDAHTAREGFVDLPSYKGQWRTGYLRAGYGDTAQGFWAQAVVQALRTKLDKPDSTLVADGDTTKVATDTITSRTQHVVAIGYRAARWQLSLTDRVRVGSGLVRHAPALRASATLGPLDAGVWLERTGRDSTTRSEAYLRAAPWSWVRLTGAVSAYAPTDSTGRPANTAVRAEAAVRFRRLWLGGGVVRTEPTVFANLPLLGLPTGALASAAAVGMMGAVEGPLYKALRVDLQAIRWNTGQYNRPRMQVHAELALITDWRSRFPKGQFGFNTRLMYDRRGGVPFYYGPASALEETEVTETAQVVTGLLEIRIQQATLFYQYRNLTGGAYEQIRGITMPPAVQMYGVRWTFFN